MYLKFVNLTRNNNFTKSETLQKVASKYRACQTLLVSFVESTFKGTFTLRTIRP